MRYLQKLIKRLKKIFKRVIILNKNYKPKGVHYTIQEYLNKSKNASIIEVFAPYTSYLNVADDFKSRFVSYVDTTIVADIPAARVVTIPDGRVHTDNNYSIAIISNEDYLIGELSFDVKNNDPAKNNIFKQSYFHHPKKYEGTVFSLLIGEGGIVNYSHWMIDSLSRIALLKKAGLFEEVDWFLVPSYQQDYQKDSLQMLGIDASKVIRGDVFNHIQADTLIATTYVRYHEHIPVWCCNFLREEFLKYRTSEAAKKYDYPYVYISRNDSLKRRVLNEPALVATLNKYGFQSFELSKLSFIEKIGLFANAKVVIATLGAGQANLVFCKQSAHVIELMAEDFAQPFFNDLANKVGMHYDYLICKSNGHAKTFKQGEKLDLTVDIAAIENKLQKILNPTSTSILQ